MSDPIQARQEPVIVKHFDSSIDEYGQKHTTFTERTTTMYLTKYTQTIESDVRYNNVVYIGLTKDDTITDEDNIIYKDKEYKVTFTIPAIGYARWNQCFLEIYEN